MEIFHICMTVKSKEYYLRKRLKNSGGGGKKRKTLDKNK